MDEVFFGNLGRLIMNLKLNLGKKLFLHYEKCHFLAGIKF
jgi:hypothetical protein